MLRKILGESLALGSSLATSEYDVKKCRYWYKLEIKCMAMILK